MNFLTILNQTTKKRFFNPSTRHDTYDNYYDTIIIALKKIQIHFQVWCMEFLLPLLLYDLKRNWHLYERKFSLPLKALSISLDDGLRAHNTISILKLQQTSSAMSSSFTIVNTSTQCTWISNSFLVFWTMAFHYLKILESRTTLHLLTRLNKTC